MILFADERVLSSDGPPGRGACSAMGRTVDPRVRGESYKVALYEDAIGLALGHVAVLARLTADAVAEAVRQEPDGGDVLAKAHIRRERERAAVQFARDRDMGRLEATMARLDAEAEAGLHRPSRVPTAADARAYLESLPDLWAATSDTGRRVIAEAVFERIDVLGASDYTFTMTAAARARGWDAAFGPGVLRLNETLVGAKPRAHAQPRKAPKRAILSTKKVDLVGARGTALALPVPPIIVPPAIVYALRKAG